MQVSNELRGRQMEAAGYEATPHRAACSVYRMMAARTTAVPVPERFGREASGAGGPRSRRQWTSAHAGRGGARVHGPMPLTGSGVRRSG